MQEVILSEFVEDLNLVPMADNAQQTYSITVLMNQSQRRSQGIKANRGTLKGGHRLQETLK